MNNVESVTEKVSYLVVLSLLENTPVAASEHEQAVSKCQHMCVFQNDVCSADQQKHMVLVVVQVF